MSINLIPHLKMLYHQPFCLQIGFALYHLYPSIYKSDAEIERGFKSPQNFLDSSLRFIDTSILNKSVM